MFIWSQKDAFAFQKAGQEPRIPSILSQKSKGFSPSFGRRWEQWTLFCIKKEKIPCPLSLVHGVKLHELSSHCLWVLSQGRKLQGHSSCWSACHQQALFSLTQMPLVLQLSSKHTGIPHFTMLHFTVLHRCCVLRAFPPQIAGETLHQQKDHNSLYCRTKPTLLPTYACRHITVHVGEHLRHFTVLDKQQRTSDIAQTNKSEKEHPLGSKPDLNVFSLIGKNLLRGERRIWDHEIKRYNENMSQNSQSSPMERPQALDSSPS